jgi:molybdopterin-containing oxidoreductase family membrane subunit
MFIVLSFAWGLAVFHLVQAVTYAWNERQHDPAIMERTKHLLGIFVIGSLYLVTVYHLTNLYFAQQVGFVRFILIEVGIYPALFWLGYIVLGNLLPLGLIYWPERKTNCVAASVLVIAGAFALLYVFIIGGQAYPLDIFPGFTASSSFGDGQIASYSPSIYELLLGLGGLAIAFLLTTVGVRIFNFMPQD